MQPNQERASLDGTSGEMCWYANGYDADRRKGMMIRRRRVQRPLAAARMLRRRRHCSIQHLCERRLCEEYAGKRTRVGFAAGETLKALPCLLFGMYFDRTFTSPVYAVFRP